MKQRGIFLTVFSPEYRLKNQVRIAYLTWEPDGFFVSSDVDESGDRRYSIYQYDRDSEELTIVGKYRQFPRMQEARIGINRLRLNRRLREVAGENTGYFCGQ